ncbi:unnamed protein product [Protopolystoma xenopodis]|uniref:Uncharacterized protein n=1 Tax=Protopolystoma xenopodis TaxID=117903 RepID=A0A3S5CK49_9PLAT|nr:unnamed protein product [Protopolystoma xenopodis]
MSYSNIRRPLQPQSPGYRRRRSPSPSSFPPDVQDDRRIVNALGVLPTPPPELEYPRPHQRQDRQRPEVYVPSHEAIFQHQSFDDGSVSRNFGLSGPNIPRCRSPEPRLNNVL